MQKNPSGLYSIMHDSLENKFPYITFKLTRTNQRQGSRKAFDLSKANKKHSSKLQVPVS